MRISDWSSDVCSSDLSRGKNQCRIVPHGLSGDDLNRRRLVDISGIADFEVHRPGGNVGNAVLTPLLGGHRAPAPVGGLDLNGGVAQIFACRRIENLRSEEHTSELQSLMRISYAVFGLKKKNSPSL